MPPYLAAQLFQVRKDETRDRQIFDKRGRNGAEGVVAPGPSLQLPSGAQLGDLSVERGREQVLLTGADRQDFYHHFKITPERLATNVVGRPRDIGDFRDLEAFPSDPVKSFTERLSQSQLGSRETRGDRLGLGSSAPSAAEVPTKVLASFNTAPMGDHLMVDTALEARGQVLEAEGLLVPTNGFWGNQRFRTVRRWKHWL